MPDRRCPTPGKTGITAAATTAIAQSWSQYAPADEGASRAVGHSLEICCDIPGFSKPTQRHDDSSLEPPLLPLPGYCNPSVL
ncbi:hypothetical protein [Halomicronema sp. CCY15110]|uniref:hypothetical protein n=1 Tax=Halomicronema sp. CCY15110 TaxID=2767773 RepID=UPI00194EC6B9|nr:hypothetical protein [Halomicronema sp. CCY15110]